jgi:hypothetical protein
MTSIFGSRARGRAAWQALAGLLMMAALALPAQADQRIALVIGNSAYPDSPLINPVNDALAVEAALTELDFEVVRVTDADLRSMQAALLDFTSRIEDDATALVFYAGHGVQASGRNYLVPIDAQLESESTLRFEALELGDVLEELEFSGSKLNIVVLDACRNNPFLRRFRGGSRGLAAVDAATGTLIAYATAPGSVASDGNGDNGLYTQYFLEALNEPNLQAESVFKQVRIGVSDASGGNQVPWESSSLTGDFVFNRQAVAAAPGSAGGTVTAAPAPVPAASPGVDVAAIAAGAEVVFWDSVRDGTDVAGFEAYLAQYPNGTFAALARARIAALEADADVVAGVAAPVPETIAGATTRAGSGFYLDVTNSTGYAMTDLRVSPASSTSWEQNFLQGARLENGQTHRVNLNGYSSPNFDVRLTDTDGDTYTFRNVDVSRQDLTVTLQNIDSGGSTAGSNDYYVEITNSTGFAMTDLRVSPASSTSWEENLLVKERIENGETRRVDLTGYASPMFDIRLTDTDGDTYTFMGVDVSARDLRVTLDDIDSSGGTTAASSYYVDVTNQTGYTIMYLYVSPASASSWGNDVLGSSVIGNGGTHRVDLSGHSSPMFDIRATDQDGDTYTFMGVDVSRRDITITLANIDG